MTTYDAQGDAEFDATETLVREWFESAVGTLSIDSATLVGEGLVAGRQLARRRRLQQLGAGAAAVALVAGGGIVALQQGLFDRNAAPPVTHLDAAVIADLPDGAKVIANGGISGPRGPRVIEADLRLIVGGSRVDLNVAATTLAVASSVSCNELHGGAASSCLGIAFPDGTHMVSTSRGRTTFALVTRHNDAVLMWERVVDASPTGDPPLTLADLRRIGSDPLVGLQTSRAMIEAGSRLDNFSAVGGLLTSPSQTGSSSGSGHAPPPTRVHTSAVPQHRGAGR